MDAPDAAEVRLVAEGLDFPEGPVVLGDGSLLVTEVGRGTLTRIADGRTEVVAVPGGGPNGAALGPDGAVYVCNNGGLRRRDSSGSIQRVDLDTGDVDELYDACDGDRLRAPNDLVFDASGGFWFTDYGRRDDRTYRYGGIYYAAADGSSIREVVFPVEHPNGVGLSPGGDTLYWSETVTGRVMRRRVVGPGELAPTSGISAATVVRGRDIDAETLLGAVAPPRQLDSLAVDGEGYVAVATLLVGGLTVFAPSGASLSVPLPDRLVTNVCFGGADMHTAFVTLAETGCVVALGWPRAGLPLAGGRR